MVHLHNHKKLEYNLVKKHPGDMKVWEAGESLLHMDLVESQSPVFLFSFPIIYLFWQWMSEGLCLFLKKKSPLQGLVATTQPTTQNNLKQLLLGWYYYR